ncbi:LOW QUALITY PROTEIN: galactosylceramide sulfotransferase-like [Diadema setosum]|uniref:LOW QUALITY PROTEIN: galactosylceramide sulfotransferase-like n=1 Tax=Diadema setosum TaxID=31175 RepID=UPI003B3B2061
MVMSTLKNVFMCLLIVIILTVCLCVITTPSPLVDVLVQSRRPAAVPRIWPNFSDHDGQGNEDVASIIRQTNRTFQLNDTIENKTDGTVTTPKPPVVLPQTTRKGATSKSAEKENVVTTSVQSQVTSSNNQVTSNKGQMTSSQVAAATCKRRYNVAFFKMHKCSSSTVQNILMRFGDKYNLDFVLPSSGNYLGHTYFSKKAAMNFPVSDYNILCHHTRFSKEGFSSVMKKDALYVTILRDPATMFESTFTYMNYPQRYHLAGPSALATFLKSPFRYYQSSSGKDHVKDSMLFDLGLGMEFKFDQAAIDKKIELTSRDFDLVMMTEYFPESLILLKDIMCWDFEDIAYFKMNARSKSQIPKISETMVKQIREWNKGDSLLYDHFNRTFWEKVRAFGEERMRKEVDQLEEMNRELRDRCIGQVVVNDRQVWHPAGVKVESFKLKPSAANDRMCKAMAKPELLMTGYIRRKQIARYYGGAPPTL